MMIFNSEDDEEYDSETELIGSKRFMPIEIPEDFDPSKVPTTGEEYLHHVMYEAQKYKNVLSARVKCNEVRQVASVNQDTWKVTECPALLLPTKAWNKDKADKFTVYRKYVQARIPQQLSTNSIEDLKWTKKIDEEDPVLSIVIKFNGRTLFHFSEALMDRLTLIKSGETIPEKVALWIFTIFSLLQVPLLSNHIFVLRSIARECSKIRSHLPQDAPSEMYTPLNLIICLIGICFGQTDVITSSD